MGQRVGLGLGLGLGLVALLGWDRQAFRDHTYLS